MSSSPKYKVVQGHFYRLALNLEQELSKIAAKLFEIGLIGSSCVHQAKNTNQVAFDRSSDLLGKVLKKIEADHRNYDRFLCVLKDFGHLVEIAKELESALKLEEGRGCVTQSSSSSSFSSSSSSSQFPKKLLVCYNSPIGRRHSDSEVIHSRCRESTSSATADSGIRADLQDSTWFTGDQLSEEDNSVDNAAISENPVPSKASSDPTTTVVTSVQSKSKLQVSQSSKASSSALVFSKHLSTGVSAAGNKPLSCGSGLGKGGSLAPGEHADDGGGGSERVPPPPLAPFPNSDTWNREAENKYLKSENTEQASELSDLRETIQQLEEERASSAEKMEHQDRLVQQKDGEIADLQQRCEEKDRRVEDLQKDKAEMEKKVSELRERCLEADRKQEEIESVHESYKTTIEELREKLREVESREKVAKEELAEARALLFEVKLQKQMEIMKLKEEFHASEKAKMRLEHNMQMLEREKEKEIALKDKKLAEVEKNQAQLTTTYTKEELKRVQEEAEEQKEELKKAQEERKQAQEEAKEQKEERKKSEVYVQEMEQEMKKLRLDHNSYTHP